MISSLALLAGPDTPLPAQLPQTEARIIETGKLARRLCMVFAVLLVLASTVVQITGAVVAHGYVGVRSNTRQIMHPTGGIIGQIYVADGDRVRKGQLLAKLNTEISGVNAVLSAQSVEKVLARQARLAAERDGLMAIQFPGTLKALNTPSAVSAMREEVQLFRLREQERTSLRVQLAQRMQQTNEQVSSYYAQIETLNRQKALIQPELAGIKDLWKRGLVTVNRLNQLERAAIDVDGSISALRAQIAQARAHSAEIREQQVSVDQTARSQAGLELTQVDAVLSDEMIKNASAADQLNRSEIRAPYDGFVDKLKLTRPGEVLQASQPLMDIVPTEQSDKVEVRVDPADVERLTLGASARVRFPAMNASATPEREGTVTFISPERMTDSQSGVTFYTAQVQLKAQGRGPGLLALRSGMPAEVYVTTGKRSLMSYILKPMTDQIAHAFRYM